MKDLKYRLPKYWAVLMTERNDRRFKKVLAYMNANSPKFIDWVGMKGCPYYGYDGNNTYNRFNAFKDLSKCVNPVVYLTLDEFDKLYSATNESIRLININPDLMYYVNYDINNEGIREYKPTVLKGADLTENQIITAEQL